MPAGVYADGDFTTPQAAGAYRFIPNPIPLQANAVIIKQRFWQYQVNYSKLNLGTVWPPSTGYYLVDETDFVDEGGGILSWERVGAGIPNGFTQKGSTIKTIKYLNLQTQGNVITAAAVATQSVTAICDIVYRYSLDPASFVVPPIPDVSVETVGTFTMIVATGGFTWSIPGGGSNILYGPRSAELSLYMGTIYQFKVVYC